MQAYSLKTEYLNNPLGIDVLCPKFFWKCRAEGEDRYQSAYRLEARREDGSVLWDTSKIESNRTTHILYGGEPLKSRMRVNWRVKLWDEHDLEGAWSEYAWFEIGLVTPSDWSATWVSAPFIPLKKNRYPADYFQKQFYVEHSIKKARLYATACGLYTARINGTHAGEDRFAPGFTDYSKRLQYQTYDVTSLLRVGENTLDFTLGDGWFRGKIGAYGKRCAYGKRTMFYAQLEITLDDGTVRTINSDRTFRWSNDGPIRENDMQDGEVYDAGRRPSLSGNAAETVFQTQLVCSNNVTVREKERFSAQLIITPNGQKVLDFSQNIAGYIRCLLPDEAGREVVLQFGETLDAMGNFTQINFQMSAHSKKPVLQRVICRCSNERAYYQPEFCVFGFRYVLVENWPENIDPEDFIAIAVYSDMEETGEFLCDNAPVNRLVENTRWSMKGNFLDVPTDCPQRERNPWTGDAQVFFETGALLMNVAPFIRKWLWDIADAQREDGMVRSLAPSQGEDGVVQMMDGSAGWADAIVLIPYRYYKIYHDEMLLLALYPAMKRYAEYIMRHAKKKSLMYLFRQNPHREFTVETGHHWGEWLEPKEDHFESIMKLGFPRPEEATAYASYTLRCMSEIANQLGFSEDARRFRAFSEGARRAYQYLFVKNDDIQSDRPAKLVRPLALDLLDEPAKTNVARRLSDVMIRRGCTVGTGFLSTPFLLNGLSKNGRLDTALETLLQKESPGWMYQLEHEATTVWENWEGFDSNGLGSLNHYSKGAVCQWLFNTLGGICIGETNTFYIQPAINHRIGDVRCSYDSIYGKVACAWKLEGNMAQIIVTIPPNTSACIHLPDGNEHIARSGKHTYFAKYVGNEQ
jgi:alpha-L-rhamnosidase